MNHFPDMSNRTRNRSKKVQCRYVVIFKKRKGKEKKKHLKHTDGKNLCLPHPVVALNGMKADS